MPPKTRLWIAIVAVAVVILGGIGITVFAVPNSQGANAFVVKSDPTANVPVSVALSSAGRRLALEIDWDDELHKAEGTDRFTARVMAGTQEIEQQQWTESRPDVHAFEMAFDEAEATQLLTAAQTGRVGCRPDHHSRHRDSRRRGSERRHNRLSAS